MIIVLKVNLIYIQKIYFNIIIEHQQLNISLIKQGIILIL